MLSINYSFLLIFIYCKLFIYLANAQVQPVYLTLKDKTHIFQNYHLNNTDDLLALKEFAFDMNQLDTGKATDKSFCDLKEVGNGWGAHFLCLYHMNFTAYSPFCNFLSMGISRDYSFDKEMDEKYHCHGFAFDPTVDYPIRITPNVIFLKAGANSPKKDPSWSSFSIPLFRKTMKKDMFAVKMDCEGCEFALAADILEHDPNFFNHMLQLNIEFHFPLSFMETENEVYGLGRLYRLLKLANMELVHHDNAPCGWNDEKLGCHKYFTDSGFPCTPACRSFLFAKRELTFSHEKHLSPKHLSQFQIGASP